VESLCFHILSHSVQSKRIEFSSGDLNTTTEHIGKSLYAILFHQGKFIKSSSAQPSNRIVSVNTVQCWFLVGLHRDLYGSGRLTFAHVHIHFPPCMPHYNNWTSYSSCDCWPERRQITSLPRSALCCRALPFSICATVQVTNLNLYIHIRYGREKVRHALLFCRGIFELFSNRCALLHKCQQLHLLEVLAKVASLLCVLEFFGKHCTLFP